MPRFARIAAAALVLGLAASPTLAADIETGKELAEGTCARCHDVNAGGAFKQFPPSFQAIAIYRSPEDIRSRIIYPPVHSSMPQMGMIWAPGNIDSVVAYILSLDTQ